MDLRNARVLVTGGAGLVGSHIVDQLVTEGVQVTVYDNFSRGTSENLESATTRSSVRVIQGDICDRVELAKAMAGQDFVFHEAAAWKHVCQEDPYVALTVNVGGTLNVLEESIKAKIKKVIAASSASVYGNSDYFPTDEKHPLNTDFFYGGSKVCGEQWLKCYGKKYGLKWIGFRYMNIYGPRQLFHNTYSDVVMFFLNRLDEGLGPEIEGDGLTASVDLVYVEDCARANILALKSDVSGEFFNVASGKETTLKELADTLIELKGLTGKVAPTYKAREAWRMNRLFASGAKAEAMLGYTPSVSLKEGAARTMAWREVWKQRHLVAAS